MLLPQLFYGFGRRFWRGVLFATILFAALMVSLVPMANASVTWTLYNAKFLDGGTVTGSFVLGSTDQPVSFDLQTSGGETIALPPRTFSSASGGTGALRENNDYLFYDAPTVFHDATSDQRLDLHFPSPLPQTGGTIALEDTSNFSLIRDDVRSGFSGEAIGVVSTVPEIPTITIVTLTLLGYAGFRLGRRQRSIIGKA
ncbi:MAG: hypothetical protein JOY96_06640 [Verrucomicrobia bacterium]|nr:hypothetical protein [Verrucomicrobiota bacterium]